MPEPTPAAPDDEAWQRFVRLLAPDARQAASAFAALRRRLVDVFRWRGLAGADELADEAIERAVRRLGAGELIANVPAYVAGVAHRLAMEAARREAKVAPLDERSEPVAALEESSDRSERLASLEQCLARLPPETQRLVLRYHADGAARIASRRALADELGIGLNALRIRVHRLRLSLEACVGGGRPDPAAAARPRTGTRPPARSS